MEMAVQKYMPHQMNQLRNQWSERAVFSANLFLLGFILFCLLISRVAPHQIKPLVEADAKTSQRIRTLEMNLQHHPTQFSQAIELAQLYQDIGEFPWSYDALQNAEKSGGDDPAWRLRLGLAYLELGKNQDGLRILQLAITHCNQKVCAAPLKVKLDIFAQVAQLFIKRKIDARRDHVAAEDALHEILKPVEVNPAKLHPPSPNPPQHNYRGGH